MKVEHFRVVGTGKNGEPIYAEQPLLPVPPYAVPIAQAYGVLLVDSKKLEAGRRRKVGLITELRSRVGTIVDAALENSLDYVETRRALIEVLEGAYQALLAERDQQRRGVKSEAFLAWEKARAAQAAPLTPHKEGGKRKRNAPMSPAIVAALEKGRRTR